MYILMEIIFSFFFYTFAITSNYIFGVPIKSILFFLLILLLIIFSSKKSIKINTEILKILFIFSVILTWFVIGIYNGFEKTSLQQLIKLFTVIGIVIVCYIFMTNHLISIHTMKNILYKTLWINIIFKLSLEFIIVINPANEEIITYICNEILKTEVMMLGIPMLGITRIGLITDTLAMALFGFFLLEKTYINKNIKILLAMSMLVYVFISFSRIHFFHFIVTMAIVLVIELKQFRLTGKSLKILCFTLIFIGIAIPFSGNLQETLTNRFIGIDAEHSDYVRDVQIIELTMGIAENPLIGQGMGAYLRHYIRSEEQLFLYEVEYLALLLQFGVIGLTLIITMYVYIFKLINFSYIEKGVKYLIIFNVIIFFFKPLFNPMLLASNYSLIIIALIIFSKDSSMRNKK